jgi:hypothetical protein
MGIDFSHSGAHWAYSGFNRARTRLAATLGFRLDDMIGFGGSRAWPDADGSPLVHLLDHSDCDGELTVAQCKVVAPALRKAVERWPDDYDKKMFLKLADGMDEAAKEGEPLRFC